MDVTGVPPVTGAARLIVDVVIVIFGVVIELEADEFAEVPVPL
jgi:hypothetical protein